MWDGIDLCLSALELFRRVCPPLGCSLVVDVHHDGERRAQCLRPLADVLEEPLGVHELVNLHHTHSDLRRGGKGGLEFMNL